MFSFAIVILIVMMVLGITRSVIGLRLLKLPNGSAEQQRGIGILCLSLVDVLISAIGLAAVITEAFRPVEIVIATWLLLILLRVAVRTGDSPRAQKWNEDTSKTKEPTFRFLSRFRSTHN